MCSCPPRPDLCHAMSCLKTGTSDIQVMTVFNTTCWIGSDYLRTEFQPQITINHWVSRQQKSGATWSSLILSSSTPWTADLSSNTSSSLILARHTPCAVALSNLTCVYCSILESSIPTQKYAVDAQICMVKSHVYSTFFSSFQTRIYWHLSSPWIPQPPTYLSLLLPLRFPPV